MEDMPKVELLTPLTANFMLEETEEEWEDGLFGYEGIELYGEDLAQYEESIQEWVEKENQMGNEDGSICNLTQKNYRNCVNISPDNTVMVGVKDLNSGIFRWTAVF